MHHVSGRTAGCTIVGPHAGDLIAHVAHVMRLGRSVGDLAEAIVPYPTYADRLRKAGDAFQRTRLTPSVQRLFACYFAVTRPR